jgi:predicted RNase H-related nuclease YkuK (DUF458 family)
MTQFEKEILTVVTEHIRLGTGAAHMLEVLSTNIIRCIQSLHMTNASKKQLSQEITKHIVDIIKDEPSPFGCKCPQHTEH